MNLWYFFRNLEFQFPKDEIDWKFLNEIFQCLLEIYENFHILELFKLAPAYLDVRAAKSKVDMIAFSSEFPPSSHQIDLAPQCEEGESVHIYVELSHPPTPPTADLYVDLAD